MKARLSLELDSETIVRETNDRGFSIVPDVLAREDAAALKAMLWEIAGHLREKGISTHTGIIDPTADNVRIYDLPDHDPAFLDLLTLREICEVVEAALGGEFIISNFSANIARPGALPMKIHSDQALSLPEPWRESWVLNVIWCFDDISEENGATRYLPGSHRLTRLADLPENPDGHTLPFEASAGSIIFMDGRLWHTSGRNMSRDRDRALAFAYYARAFIRPQNNWHETLSPEVIAGLDERQRGLFGFGPLANTHGVPLIALDTAG